MATIQSAKANYLRKVPQMSANYVAGVSAFLGTQINPSCPAVIAYNGKINTSAADKWERNYRAAFTG